CSMRDILAAFVLLSTIVFATTAPTNQTHDSSGTKMKDEKPMIPKILEPVSESVNKVVQIMTELLSSVRKLSASGNSGSKSRQSEWKYEGITEEVTGMHLIENFLKKVTGRDYRQESNDVNYGKPKKQPVQKAPCTRLFSWCNLKDLFGGK
ncbi:unnamed protein product, partial [Allacma fusca]